MISLCISCGRDPINIIDAFNNNETIEELTLIGIFGNEFIDRFSKMLTNNNNLKSLSLYVVDNSNCIQSIATALQSNSSLTSLRIVYDSINSEDMIAIANMLSSNTTLHRLKLSCDNEDDRHKYAHFFDIFENAISNNYTLQYFNVLEECDYVVEYFERNKKFSDKKRFIKTKCVESPTNII